MTVESIINVTITSNSLVGSVASFGVPLVVGKHSAYSDIAKVYNSDSAKSQLVSDGIPTTHPIYRAVNSLLTAKPSPSKIVVGRATGTFSQLGTLEIIGTPYEGQVYAFTLRNAAGVATSISHTVTAGPQTLAQIATAVAALITAVSGITATATDAVIDWEIDADDAVWTFESLAYTQFVFEDTTVAPSDITIAADMAAIKGANNTWYAAVYAGPQSTDINTDFAAWVESEDKMFFALTHNDNERDSADTTRLSYVGNAASYFRSDVFYSQDQTTHAVGAWLSRTLPADPGAETWEYKLLAGTTGDIVDGDMETAATHASYYHYGYGGYAGATINSKTAGGEWIDVVIFRDWIVARLREAILRLLMNAPKIPYTDAGVELVLKEIRQVLNLGVTRGGIDDTDEAPIVSAPRVADVSTTDRANRLLPDIVFSARLAGAIHAVSINGALLV